MGSVVSRDWGVVEEEAGRRRIWGDIDLKRGMPTVGRETWRREADFMMRTGLDLFTQECRCCSATRCPLGESKEMVILTKKISLLERKMAACDIGDVHPLDQCWTLQAFDMSYFSQIFHDSIGLRPRPLGFTMHFHRLRIIEQRLQLLMR